MPKAKCCIYKGQAFPSLKMAADAFDICPMGFTTDVRNGVVEDFQEISQEKYLELVGANATGAMLDHHAYKQSKPVPGLSTQCHLINTAWPVPKRMAGNVLGALLDIILVLMGVMVLYVLTQQPAQAKDKFGTYCIDINGVERCTIFKWDSKQQKVIRKEIVRSSLSKRSTRK